MAWIIFGFAAAVLAAKTFQQEVFRLPTSVLPINYDITIEPNFDDLTFKGKVDIRIEVREQVSFITLHAKNLDLSEVKLQNQDLKPGEFDEDLETVKFNLVGYLAPETYTISIAFRSTLSIGDGFVVSKYTNADNQERKFAFTNLHYTKARQVFPCFDEPHIQATFSIHVTRPENYISISNMVKLRQDPVVDGKVTDVYMETSLMPAYLVSIVVLDFQKVPNNDVSLYVAQAEEAQFKYFPTVMTAVMDGADSLYAWKTDKLDIVVLPDAVLSRDVVGTPGVVLCRKSLVAIDDARATSKQKQSMHQLAVDILARQYYWKNGFGLGGSGFWLEGAVASYYHSQILHQVQPSWRIREQFVVRDLHRALRADCKSSAAKLSSYEENLNVLDDATFQVKTSALVHVLLQESFPHNGFDIITRIGKLTEDPIVKSWKENLGYPVTNALHNRETHTLSLQQNTFRYDSGSPSTDSLWRIPFSFLLKLENFEQHPIAVQKDRVIYFDLSAVDTGSSPLLMVIDKQPTGFFRVNYDETNWNLITSLLRSPDMSKLAPLYRAQIVDDAFNLAKSSYLDYSIILALSGYISQEIDYIPLHSLIQGTSELKFLLSGSEAHDKFVDYILELAAPLYSIVGSNIRPFEGHLDRLNRLQVITWLCNFGHSYCEVEMFNTLNSFQTVHADMEEAVYCGGMRRGALGNFLFLTSKFKALPHKKWILTGMGCTSSEELLNYYLPIILDKSPYLTLSSAEDKMMGFAAIYEGSNAGADMALDYLANKSREFTTGFTHDQVSSMIEGLSRRLYTTEHLAKVNQISSGLNEEASDNLAEAFETARSNINFNIDWREAHLTHINNLLDQLAGTTTEETTTITTELTVKTTQTTTQGIEATTTEKPQETTTESVVTTTKGPGAASAVKGNLLLHILLVSILVIS